MSFYRVSFDKLCLLIFALIGVLYLGIALIYPAQSQALSGSDFNAGRIIDDEIFYNKDAMTTAQIQSFLNAKLPACDTNGNKLIYDSANGDTVTRKVYSQRRGVSTPFTCLKSYQQNTPEMEAASGLCNSITGGNKSAAQIINDVSKACGINPQVLLVLLQKEQSLITDDWPWPVQYQKATGFSCPDTAPCDPAYAGFFYQVYYAARQFKVYAKYPDNYNYKAGRNNYIYYNPNLSACGGSTVFIQNQATASLYIYTPYQPNSAALNNLYGTGNSCSAYGNRNFWRMFNDWFGQTTGTRIEAVVFDQTTDKTGEQARVGIKLTKKPTDNVYLSFYVQSPSNAKIVGSSTVRITGSTWNKPHLNAITVVGLDNPNLAGSFQYYLKPSARASTSDTRYSSISTEYIVGGGVPLLQMDSNSQPTVYRLYSEINNKHTFTSSLIEKNNLINDGYRNETNNFSYCRAGERTISRLAKDGDVRLVQTGSSLYGQLLKEGFTDEGPAFSASSQGSKPVYWRYDATNKRSLYTTSPTEGVSAGFQDMGIAFYACANDHKPVYRLYKKGGSHFYTASAAERDKALYTLGYRYEKLGHYICESGNIPIHRFIKESTGVRFYTLSETEFDRAKDVLNYTYEGVAYRICEGGNTEVLRLYNKKNGFRFFTTSESERDSAARNHGYTYEGVGFRGE